MDDPQRVFLSHTSELDEFPIGRSFVAAARSAIERAGDVVVEMSTFPPAHLPTEDVCRERVRSSTVLVLIVGFRYGSTPPDRPGVSYVELEFDTAAALGAPRIVILLGEDPAGPDAPTDERQIAFRDRLRRSGVVATVTTPDALETEVLHALTAIGRGHRADRPGAITADIRDCDGVQVGGVQYNDFTIQGRR